MDSERDDLARYSPEEAHALEVAAPKPFDPEEIDWGGYDPKNPWYTHRGAWAIGGVLLGIGIVLGAQSITKAPTSGPITPQVLVNPKQPEKKPDEEILKPPPSMRESTATKQPEVQGPKPATGTSLARTTQEVPTQKPNYDPPPRMNGTISPGGISVTKDDIGLEPMRVPAPGEQVGASENPAAGSGKSMLLVLSLTTEDGEKSRRSFISLLNDEGGTARAFTDYSDDPIRGKPALLGFVPMDKISKVLDRCTAMGAGLIEPKWSGTPGERRARLEGSLRKRIDELRKKRSELLVRFLETADPVKECDEDLAHLNETLKALQVGSRLDGQAVVRISFERA